MQKRVYKPHWLAPLCRLCAAPTVRVDLAILARDLGVIAPTRLLELVPGSTPSGLLKPPHFWHLAGMPAMEASTAGREPEVEAEEPGTSGRGPEPSKGTRGSKVRAYCECTPARTLAVVC